MKNNLVFGIIVGLILSLGLEIIADTIITSESVSYSNNKTTETTVNGALNELFSAVDINNRIGNNDISSIGDGTITGALSNINNNVSMLNSKYDELANFDFLTAFYTNGETIVVKDLSQYKWISIVGELSNGTYLPFATVPIGVFKWATKGNGIGGSYVQGDAQYYGFCKYISNTEITLTSKSTNINKVNVFGIK